MTTHTFDQWLQSGIDQKWVTPIFCQTHDMTPMTDDELHQFDEGFDPCIPVIRINTESTDQ
jgi:hypothetical protein